MIDVPFCFSIRADDRATFESIEYFRRVKTQYRKSATIKNTAIFDADTKSMRGVIDHFQAMPLRNLLNAIDVAGHAITVHWKNCSCSGRDSCFYFCRIEIAG